MESAIVSTCESCGAPLFRYERACTFCQQPASSTPFGRRVFSECQIFQTDLRKDLPKRYNALRDFLIELEARVAKLEKR